MNKIRFFRNKFFLLLILVVLCSTSLFSDAKKPVFDDSVFMVDEIIKFGEEYFLQRIGLDGAEKVAEILYASPENIENTESDSPVGIVFSGGAARAFAHIGVLKKLEEEGIFPDFIVANSMGSLVGLLYAAGLSPDLIERMVMEYPTDFLFTARLPIDGGVIDDYNMISVLYNLLGDLDIKDLEIPTVVLAEDLQSRRQIAFMEGDFYKILSATISMPMSFPPVEYKNMTLIDGGTTNLVPVKSASEYTDRIIVATTFANPDNKYRDLISVISRALDIGKTRTGIEELKSIDNILIRCNVEDFSYMDFQKANEMVKRGIESTEIVIDEIKNAGFHKTTTWNDARMAQFMAKRDQISERYAEVLADYKRTGMIEQKEAVGYLTLGAEMYSGAKDDYYLDNSDYLYFSQKGEVSTVMGEIREYWDPWRGFGLDARLNFSLFNLVSFKNRLMFKWEDWASGNLIKGFDGIFYYGRIDFNITNDGKNGIKPFLAWEGFFSNDYGLENGVESAFGRAGIDLYLENYSITPYVFSEVYPILGMGIENDFKIKLADSFYIGQKTAARFPFDASHKISLYKNDGLRGAVTEGVFDYFVVTNNNLTFEIETVGSFFESIVVKNLGISVFCDYYKTDAHGLSAGLELDVNIALLGLVSFSLTSYGGWDFQNNSAFGSISIGINK